MKRSEQLAALIAVVLAIPLVASYAAAMHDGEVRSRETVFRAVLGDARFDELMAGEGGFPHYLGNTLGAPDVTLTDREGNPWRLADHRGKVVVLNFWSITCPPCLEELPSLEILAQFAERWGDVEVVAVSADPGWDAVSSVVAPDTRMTHVFDPTREAITGRFGTRLFPETWIIDKGGVVRFRYDGAMDWSSPLAVQLVDTYR